MLSMKKPIIVMLLIFLLVITGYLNHNLTKQASSKVSHDYQKYEEMELAKGNLSEESDLLPAISEGEDNDNDLEILDTRESEDVNRVAESAETYINQTIDNEQNLRSKNYFIEQRLSRDKLRAGLIGRLNEIVNNDKTNDDIRTEAQRKIIKIGEISEKELTIEGLVKAKGFEDVLAFLTEEKAKVVIAIEELSEQDVIKVLDIVITETNLEASDVKIMKKN